MSISVVCPFCGKVLQADESLKGRQVRCAACAHVFAVAADTRTEDWDESANPASYSQTKDQGGKAIASFVLGLVSFVCWCLPIIGLPMTIVGLVLGILDQKSSKRGLAIAGIVMNFIGLVLSVANAAAGAYMAATGQHPLLRH